MSKTNYRNVFKSDHLGQVDCEELKDKGHNLIFKIREVRQERGAKVAGKKIDANICYFQEKGIKPWVVNATNGLILKKFSGSIYVEDWAGLTIQLYIDPSVTMKGQTTGGIKIMPTQPAARQVLTPKMGKAWNNAKAAFLRDGNLGKVKARMDISQEDELLLISECQEVK